MKIAIFALLLVVAGVFAIPETAKVDAAQGRIVDIVIRDTIQRVTRWIRNRGLDPLEVAQRNFQYAFPGIFSARGSIEDFKLVGISNIVIRSLSYNILIGRLEFDFVIPEISVSLGKGEITGLFGTRIVEGEASGSLKIKEITLRGNALLILEPNWIQVYNINVDARVGDIASDLKVVGSDDYSDRVNNFINVRIPDFLQRFRNEINLLIGEGIRRAVTWWNANRPRIDMF